MKKHKKNTKDNIIEEAISLASKDPNNMVQAFSIIGIAMMDDVYVYVPVQVPKDWETYRTTMRSDYVLKDKDGTSCVYCKIKIQKMSAPPFLQNVLAKNNYEAADLFNRLL